MKVLIGGRASGKTYQLLRWVKENPNRILIVGSERERRYLVQKDNELIHQLRSPGQIDRLQGMHRDYEVGVDNVGEVLASLISVMPSIVSIDTMDIVDLNEGPSAIRI